MPKGKRCQHGNYVCARCVVVSDAARRMSDHINARVVSTPPDELFHNPYMAFALEDGRTDGVLYPTKSEAVRHQPNEFRYMYFSFRRSMGGCSPKDAQLFLEYHRHAYDNGLRLTDPDNDMITPLARGQGAWPM